MVHPPTPPYCNAEEDICSEADSETDDQSYPPPPEVHAPTWQGYVAHIVRMVSCIAYCIH